MREKDLVLKYIQRWLSVNEILVFFNRQYFTNRLISDFDFWQVEIGRMNGTSSINRFSEKKILIWANGPFWAPKLRIITLDPPEGFF